jgi:hypothetical protein
MDRGRHRGHLPVRAGSRGAKAAYRTPEGEYSPEQSDEPSYRIGAYETPIDSALENTGEDEKAIQPTLSGVPSP